MKKSIFSFIGLGVAAICFLVILQAANGKKCIVTLDNYFNHETHKTTGKVFHYTWDDTNDSGYSLWGEMFQKKGFLTETLAEKPSKKNLKNSQVYIIVDPDTEKETAKPNYMDQQSIAEIEKWVKTGGILVLMTNDMNNCEFEHFNKLAEKFGFTFNQVIRNIPGAGNVDMAKATFTNLPSHPFFKDVNKVFIKEICTLSLKDRSNAILSEGGDDILAIIPYGKGKVVAIPDPWFYNEYLNGHPKCRLTDEYQNGQTASNIVDWLYEQVTKK